MRNDSTVTKDTKNIFEYQDCLESVKGQIVQDGIHLVALFVSSRAHKLVKYGMIPTTTLDLEKRALFVPLWLRRLGGIYLARCYVSRCRA